MYEPEWKRPRSKAEALAILADLGTSATVIAGGTDLASLITSGAVRPTTLVDLGYASDLRYVRESSAGPAAVEIGAISTHADLSRDELIGNAAGVLSQACSMVGGPQVRARGTIAGNVANASPAADGAVALTALRARAVLESGSGRREVALTDFFTGPGETIVAPGELVTGFAFDRPADDARFAYLKEGQRNALAIAVVSVGVMLEPERGALSIALGSVAPTPVRALEAERIFAERWSSAGDRSELLRDVAAAALRAADPIDDVRATADYRSILVEVLTRRALENVVV